MGSGIAQVAATAGCKVSVFDNNPEALKRSADKLEKILNRLIEKERIDEAKKNEIQGNIKYINALVDLKDADLVIEAIIENAEIKHQVFKELSIIVSPECILASNTSSLSITSLAAAIDKPARFIGIHFFNPAPLMKLVEVIPAIQTSPSVLEKAKVEIERWGKLVVQVKDSPGFIVNKVARPFYSEALRIYDEGIADVTTIDQAMKEIGGFRMGPFELMDFIGNDVNYTVTETVWKAFYMHPRYRPSLTQKRLSEAGYHGRKSGRGYYKYENGEVKPITDPSRMKPDTHQAKGKMICDRIVAMIINEAADTLYMGIATQEDIDTAMTKGVNYPKGPFAWADEIGIEKVVTLLDGLYNEYHDERYAVCPLLRQKVRDQSRFS